MPGKDSYAESLSWGTLAFALVLLVAGLSIDVVHERVMSFGSEVSAHDYRTEWIDIPIYLGLYLALAVPLIVACWNSFFTVILEVRRIRYQHGIAIAAVLVWFVPD